MTIKQRLIILAALVAVGMLLQVGLIQYSIDTGSELDEVRLNIEEANSGMLLLRRREKDFLARHDLAYEEKFVKDHTALVAKVNELAGNLSVHGMDTVRAMKMRAILEQYKTIFLQLVALQKRIGVNEKEGLYGSLRTAVHGIEGELDVLEDDRLTGMMLTLRRNEKDFMLRNDLKYRDKLDGNVEKLRSAINESAYPEESKAKLQGLLKQYQSDFHALVAGYIEKGLSSKEGLLGQLREVVHQTETLHEEMAAAAIEATHSEIASLKITVTAISFIILVLALVVMVTLAGAIIRPVEVMMAVMSRVREEDDLSLRAPADGKDEIASMGGDLNKLLEEFQGVIQVVLGSTEQVSRAAEELSSITEETNVRMQQQVSDTDMVAAAIEEMSASVQEVASSSAETAHTTQKAEGAVARGSQVVNDTVSNINSLAGEVASASEVISHLEQESNNIGTVLDVIRGIAEQTNLLALNAAIEAARAGEQGRGFAVVADEVRSLASRTQQSTQEINEMIERLQEGTRRAVAAMERGRASAESGVSRASEANEALDEITSAIATIHDMATYIASASQQQGEVAGEVAASTGAIKHTVDETGDNVHQITIASSELAELANRMHGQVSHFKV